MPVFVYRYMYIYLYVSVSIYVCPPSPYGTPPSAACHEFLVYIECHCHCHSAAILIPSLFQNSGRVSTGAAQETSPPAQNVAQHRRTHASAVPHGCVALNCIAISAWNHSADHNIRTCVPLPHTAFHRHCHCHAIAIHCHCHCHCQNTSPICIAHIYVSIYLSLCVCRFHANIHQ